MNCPFCGEKLKTRKLLCGTKDYVCVNNDCNFSYMPLPLKFWQALIDGKKAQEALQVATEVIIGAAERRGVELIDWCNSGLKRIAEITESKEK